MAAAVMRRFVLLLCGAGAIRDEQTHEDTGGNGTLSAEGDAATQVRSAQPKEVGPSSPSANFVYGSPVEVKVGIEVGGRDFGANAAPSKSVDDPVFQQLKINYEIVAWNTFERFYSEQGCNLSRCSMQWTLDDPNPGCCELCKSLFASKDRNYTALEIHADLYAKAGTADNNPVHTWTVGYNAFRKFHEAGLPLLTFPRHMRQGATWYPKDADPFWTHPFEAVAFWELRNEGFIKPFPTPLPDREELRELIKQRIPAMLIHLVKLWQYCKNLVGNGANAGRIGDLHSDEGVLRQYLDLDCAIENYDSKQLEGIRQSFAELSVIRPSGQDESGQDERAKRTLSRQDARAERIQDIFRRGGSRCM